MLATDCRIVVHSLDQARAAVAAAAALDLPVTIASAAGAGAYGGPLWFKALIAEATRDHPDAAVTAVLDCADEAGTALAALRAGLTRVRFTGPEPMRSRIAEIAAALGATVESEAGGQTLDLLDAPDPEGSARAFLAGSKSRG
jgi:fructose/tagatose bisphosphate aldolase